MGAKPDRKESDSGDCKEEESDIQTEGGFTNADVKSTLARAYSADTPLKLGKNRQCSLCNGHFTLGPELETAAQPLNALQVFSATELEASILLRGEFVFKMHLYLYKNITSRSLSVCERRTQK